MELFFLDQSGLVQIGLAMMGIGMIFGFLIGYGITKIYYKRIGVDELSYPAETD